MHTIDLIILLLLGIGLLRGIYKGLFMEVTSFIALFTGIYCGFRFSGSLAEYLSRFFNWEPSTLKIASFVLILVMTVLLLFLLGKLLTKIASFAAMGWLNRLLGGVFGTLKMLVVASAACLIFHSLNKDFNWLTEENLDQSHLYVPLYKAGALVYEWTGQPQ